MPTIATLLDRATTGSDGLYVHQPWTFLEGSDRPAVEKSWEAWVRAYVALARDDFGTARPWLQTADDLLADAPNELCLAEVLSAWARYYDRVEEPRTALQYAHAAWQHWYDLAGSPPDEAALESVRGLVAVLGSPDEPLASDERALYEEWLADRLTLEFHGSVETVVRLAGQLGVEEPGTAVAEAMREWYDANLGHLPVELSGVVYAGLLGDVANMYDQLGDPARSLEAYREALALLERTVDHPEVRWKRATYRFNVGNQLAKLGEHEEAAAVFEESAAEFAGLDEWEPELRARHARFVSRWYLGEIDGLRDDLEDLLFEYEVLLEDADSAVERRTVRENVDAAYRLWLTLAAVDANDDERLTQRLLGQLFAIREGSTDLARTWATLDAEAADGAVWVEAGLLERRLARLDGAVLLIVESGVGRAVLVTVRSETGGVLDQVRTELASEAFADALGTLLEEYRAAADGFADRTVGLQSAPTGAFETACREVWDALPQTVRRDIADARTLIVSPSNAGNLDEVPVELFHDGSDYLGRTRSIVRAPSLSQLLATLSENRLEVEPRGTGLIVRAAATEEMGSLPQADSEVRWTEQSLRSFVPDVRVLTEPSRTDILEALDAGVDVLHYVGHGFADEHGEALRLGEDEVLSARDLATVGPVSTPVAVMSSCLVGRARHLRSGEQRGIAVTLLESGSPAVVAATYALPDLVGSQFALAFYHHAREAPLGEALRRTRRTLAAQGYHPGVWASFVALGHPDAPIVRDPSSDAEPTRSWSASLPRYVATGAEGYLDATRRGLRADARLSPEQVHLVESSLDAFVAGDGAAFAWDRLVEPSGLESTDVEAALSYWALLAIGYLRFGSSEDADRAAGRQHAVLDLLLERQGVLHDTYLLLAVVTAFAEVDTLPVDSDRGRHLLWSGVRALEWVDADAELLVDARETISTWRDLLERSVVVSVPELIGVDVETFAAADAGDPDALERVNRLLSTKLASTTAVTSTRPWTDWMLRTIGCCGTHQSLSDLLGVLERDRNAGALSDAEADALVDLVEDYSGPGEIDADRVLAAFEAVGDFTFESDVLDLFVVFDRLASGERDVPLEEVQRAVVLAKALDASGAEAFFTSVVCQKLGERGQFEAAASLAWDVLENYESLAEEDPEYGPRVGVTAILLRQLYQYLDDEETVARLDSEYADDMAAYRSGGL